MSLDPAIASCVGQGGLPWPWEVTTTGIRAFARAAGFTDLVYYDVATALAAGHPALPAPPGFLGLPIYLPGGLDETFGQPSFGQVDVPHGLNHVLEARTEIEHHLPLYAGDDLVGVTVVASIRERRSPRGGRGLQVTRETSLTRNGELAGREIRVTLHAERLPW